MGGQEDMREKLEKAGRILIGSGWHRKVFLFQKHFRSDFRLVKDFLHLARLDLEAANILRDHGLNTLAVFHLQQSVEKAAKAFALDMPLISERELLKIGHVSPMAFLRILNRRIGREYAELLRDVFPALPAQYMKMKGMMSREKQVELARLSTQELRKRLSGCRQLWESYPDMLRKVFHSVVNMFDKGMREKMKYVNAKSLDVLINGLVSWVTLSMLSEITFAHESFTRYPPLVAKSVHPNEYVRNMGIVEVFEEASSMMEKVICDLSSWFQDHGKTEGRLSREA